MCKEMEDGCDSECENSDCEGEQDEAGFYPGTTFYKTDFTKVSKFLAFDLMPNLQINTHRVLD